MGRAGAVRSLATRQRLGSKLDAIAGEAIAPKCERAQAGSQAHATETRIVGLKRQQTITTAKMSTFEKIAQVNAKDIASVRQLIHNIPA